MSLTRFFRRGAWDDERAKELEDYLAIETDDNIARGMNPADARDAARRKLGNATAIREEIYQMNTLAFFDNAWRDLRHGARLLRMNPGFAAVAILSLALGVGANTAIFQLLDAVRLRTLPVQDPNRLVEIRIGNASGGGRTGQFSGRHPNLTNQQWERIRDRQQPFSSVFAWSNVAFNLTTGGEARSAEGLWVSGDFFDGLGVPALAGRVLTASDDRRGCTAPAAVLGYGFWQREYAGNPSVVGRSIMLDGHSYDIVGVTPASFFGVEVGRAFDVAVPLCAEPLTRGPRTVLDRKDAWFLAAMGRLKPGVSAGQAQAQLEAISPAIMKETLPEYRVQDADRYLQFKFGTFPGGTGTSSLRRAYESPLWLLLATTGLVLLIACANLANLMLARATVREREIAVRLAIGASRARVMRQLLAESLLIAAIGAAGGALLAQWLSRFLVGFLNTESSRIFVALSLDWRIFAFAAALAALTCLVFGLVPAIRATGTSPGVAMKAGSRGSTDTRERFGVRRVLVVAQVALSLVLVVGALLFVRSLRNLMTLDAGFTQDNILIVNLDARRSGIAELGRRDFYADLIGRVAALPGVASAAQVDVVPVSGSGWNNNITIGGKKYKENVNFNRVGPGYFKTMGTPLLAGRDFDATDTPGPEPSAIVTQLFAKQFFPNQDPIGQMFQIDEAPGQPNPPYRIVGIVKDTKYTDLREEFTPLAYLASSQEEKPGLGMQFVVRSSAPTGTITAEVSSLLAQTNRNIIVDFQTMKTQVRESLLRERLMATLSGFFGGLAALLATIGLYGVMSYMVARRRNEIGIRMALGADRRDVVRMVLREAGVLLLAGVAVGTVLAIAAARTASTLLFGLSPGDPSTLAMAAGGLGIVAMLASYLPALRASRLEPTEALREE
jgi:putative ABC transport system permease protein